MCRLFFGCCRLPRRSSHPLDSCNIAVFIVCSHRPPRDTGNAHNGGSHSDEDHDSGNGSKLIEIRLEPQQPPTVLPLAKPKPPPAAGHEMKDDRPNDQDDDGADESDDSDYGNDEDGDGSRGDVHWCHEFLGLVGLAGGQSSSGRGGLIKNLRSQLRRNLASSSSSSASSRADSESSEPSVPMKSSSRFSRKRNPSPPQPGGKPQGKKQRRSAVKVNGGGDDDSNTDSEATEDDLNQEDDQDGEGASQGNHAHHLHSCPMCCAAG